MDEQNDYKSFVEHLVLNNRIQYSDIPQNLRIHNLGLFYYAMRVVRDHVQDATQFVSVMEQFLQDIDEIEKQSDVNLFLRRRAVEYTLDVKNLFMGVEVFDAFIQQQRRTRPWLFTDG